MRKRNKSAKKLVKTSKKASRKNKDQKERTGLKKINSKKPSCDYAKRIRQNFLDKENENSNFKKRAKTLKKFKKTFQHGIHEEPIVSKKKKQKKNQIHRDKKLNMSRQKIFNCVTKNQKKKKNKKQQKIKGKSLKKNVNPSSISNLNFHMNFYNLNSKIITSNNNNQIRGENKKNNSLKRAQFGESKLSLNSKEKS